jgi:hypothetical protein
MIEIKCKKHIHETPSAFVIKQLVSLHYPPQHYQYGMKVFRLLTRETSLKIVFNKVANFLIQRIYCYFLP